MYLYLDINTHFKVSIITPMNSLKVLQIRIASLEIHKDERWWSSYLRGPTFKITSGGRRHQRKSANRRSDSLDKGSLANTKHPLLTRCCGS